MLSPVLVLLCFSQLLLLCSPLPIVDPGLFVIMGVRSCRAGSGYCLLGLDCTLDEDFLPDDEGGHCDGLRSAFTPSAHFICCRYNSGNKTDFMANTTTPVTLILGQDVTDNNLALIDDYPNPDTNQESDSDDALDPSTISNEENEVQNLDISEEDATQLDRTNTNIHNVATQVTFILNETSEAPLQNDVLPVADNIKPETNYIPVPPTSYETTTNEPYYTSSETTHYEERDTTEIPDIYEEEQEDAFKTLHADSIESTTDNYAYVTDSVQQNTEKFNMEPEIVTTVDNNIQTMGTGTTTESLLSKISTEFYHGETNNPGLNSSSSINNHDSTNVPTKNSTNTSLKDRPIQPRIETENMVILTPQGIMKAQPNMVKAEIDLVVHDEKGGIRLRNVDVNSADAIAENKIVTTESATETKSEATHYRTEVTVSVERRSTGNVGMFTRNVNVRETATEQMSQVLDEKSTVPELIITTDFVTSTIPTTIDHTSSTDPTQRSEDTGAIEFKFIGKPVKDTEEYTKISETYNAESIEDENVLSESKSKTVSPSAATDLDNSLSPLTPDSVATTTQHSDSSKDIEDNILSELPSVRDKLVSNKESNSIVENKINNLLDREEEHSELLALQNPNVTTEFVTVENINKRVKNSSESELIMTPVITNNSESSTGTLLKNASRINQIPEQTEEFSISSGSNSVYGNTVSVTEENALPPKQEPNKDYSHKFESPSMSLIENNSAAPVLKNNNTSTDENLLPVVKTSQTVTGQSSQTDEESSTESSHLQEADVSLQLITKSDAIPTTSMDSVLATESRTEHSHDDSEQNTSSSDLENVTKQFESSERSETTEPTQRNLETTTNINTKNEEKNENVSLYTSNDLFYSFETTTEVQDNCDTQPLSGRTPDILVESDTPVTPISELSNKGTEKAATEADVSSFNIESRTENVLISESEQTGRTSELPEVTTVVDQHDQEKNDVPEAVTVSSEITVTSAEPSIEPDVTTPCGITKSGRSQCWFVQFMSPLSTNSTLCVGSYLDSSTILTSANCVSRIFDHGLTRVSMVSAGGAVTPPTMIHDIIVHEEYRNKGVQFLLNDIGLVRLKPENQLPPAACALCLPKSDRDLLDRPCEEVKQKSLQSDMQTGSSLVCSEGILGGVASYNNPTPVYTPINEYVTWIRTNQKIKDNPHDEWK